MTSMEEKQETTEPAGKLNAGSVVGKYLWIFELSLLAVYLIVVISGIPFNDKRILTGVLAVFAVLYLIAGIWGRDFETKKGWRHFINSGGLVILSFALLALIYFFKGWPWANAILIIISIGLVVIVLLSLTTLKGGKGTFTEKLLIARLLAVTILLLLVILVEFLNS